MSVREAGSPAPRDGGDGRRESLRARWRTASIGAGWRYPSDWGLPEVDAVCTAALSGADLAGPLSGLGQARAVSGAALDETLADVAALHAALTDPCPRCVDPDAAPAWMLRTTAVGWADGSAQDMTCGQVRESLTGLATPAYLRTRLAEVYRQAERDGRPIGHVLVTVRVDLSAVVGWSRIVAMVLAADVVREVFDGGESLVLLGPSVAAVLTARELRLPHRVMAVRRLLNDQLSVDPDLHPAAPVDVRVHRLPDNHEEVRALLTTLSRA